MMQVASILLCLILLFSLITGCRNTCGLNRNNTSAAKGLLAISIILCHLTSHTSYHLPLFSFSVMGSTGVGCFFFLSGYGLVISAKNESYFRDYISRHAGKILIPYALMLATWLLVFQIGFREPVSYFIQSFRNGDPVSNSWYVFASLYCYLLFWIAYKRKTRASFVLILAGLVVWIIFMVDVLSWQDWWYRTIICFAFGIIWGTHYKHFSACISAHRVSSIIIALALYALAYISPSVLKGKLPGDVVWLINDSTMGIFGALLMAIVLEQVSLVNKVTSFLGEISYELYLFHGILIKGFDKIPRGGVFAAKLGSSRRC